MKKLRIVFLLSGRGSTLDNLLVAIRDKDIPVEIVKVISSLKTAGGLEIASREGIPSAVVRVKDHPDVAAFSEAVTREIDSAQPDYIVFGGYMCRYLFPERYCNRIINVHPALLPSFGGKGMYGQNVHASVLEHGVKVTGCTVHFVDENYDTGPIIAQKAVKVRESDDTHSLALRVQVAERKLLPRVIRLLAQGRITVAGRKVVITPKCHGKI